MKNPSLFAKIVYLPETEEEKAVREVHEDSVPFALFDPNFAAAAVAIGKRNCAVIMEDSKERIQHFKRRITEKGLNDKEYCIIVVNVDDPHGGPIAEVLMPDCDTIWQSYRDAGQVPVARGIAPREWLTEAVAFFDEIAASKLRDMDGVVILVVDHGVAEVYPA